MKYHVRQRLSLMRLINRGELKGPSMRDLSLQRDEAAKDIARADQFYADPIGSAIRS